MPLPEPVSVVLPIHNAGGTLSAAVAGWFPALAALKREWELLVIDDGSTDDTAALAEQLAAKHPGVKLLRHETRQGFGAALRTGFAAARFPLVAYSSLGYPYSPADLGTLLARLADVDPVFNRPLDVVSGCRTGRPVPPAWKFVGRAYRLFCRAAFGLPLEPLPGWHGFGSHLRAWRAWLVFGVPFVDVNSAFRVFRKAVLDRFPIQSDGDFVHAELAAKATFLGCLMDELPLTPKPDPVPPAEWSDAWAVLKHAKFHPPAEPAAVT